MGSCSILAIKNNDLFHIKITHIENCFCSVEQSLPLAKTAKSLAWPLAWLAIFTKHLLAQPLELSLVYQDLQVFFLHKQSSSNLLWLPPSVTEYRACLTTEPVGLLSLTTWAWLPEPDCLSLTTWAWLLEPDYPDYLSLTTLTTWAWLLEPNYPDYLSHTTWAWLPEPDYLSLTTLTTWAWQLEPDYLTAKRQLLTTWLKIAS